MKAVSLLQAAPSSGRLGLTRAAHDLLDQEILLVYVQYILLGVQALRRAIFKCAVAGQQNLRIANKDVASGHKCLVRKVPR